MEWKGRVVRWDRDRKEEGEGRVEIKISLKTGGSVVR